jgi:DNA-binding CsgD family transcriptional regulator
MTTATVETTCIDEIAVERAVSGERVCLSAAERAEAIRLLHGRGLSAQQIAERLHVTARTVQRYRVVLGVAADPPDPGAVERREALRGLLGRGLSDREIGRRVGVTEETARTWRLRLTCADCGAKDLARDHLTPVAVTAVRIRLRCAGCRSARAMWAGVSA